MEYKVNYQKNIGPDGTVYDQCIKALMTSDELKLHNEKVQQKKNEINEQKAKSSNDINFMCFVRFLLNGKNHTTVTQRDYFLSHFNISDKRILDRNTIIIIKIKK